MQLQWKKSEQSQAGLVPAWHPNFRNHEQLPDTKVVRTFFFVNVTAITMVLSFVLLFVFQQLRINNLGRQVADWQANIATNKKSADEAVVLSRKFSEEEKKIRELDAFLKPRLVLSEFLIYVGKTLPSELVMDTIEVRDSGVTIHGLAAGLPDEASGRISAYVNQLQQDKYFASLFESKDVRQEVRNDKATGRMGFDLTLRYKGEPKK
jgi:hypothetical protein